MLAPWNGGLYRANVLGVKDNILTVLYVDHGNTDTVSWWDCFSVHEDFLVPPHGNHGEAGWGADDIGVG